MSRLVVDHRPNPQKHLLISESDGVRLGIDKKRSGEESDGELEEHIEYRSGRCYVLCVD